MHKHVRALSTHVAYIRRLSAVCAIILCVGSEIAADWSAEETRGSCQCWGPRIYNSEIDVLSTLSQVCEGYEIFVGRVIV